MKAGIYCLLLACAGAFALSGCDSRPDVVTYTAPKDPKPLDTAAAGATAPASNGGPGGSMQPLPGMAEAAAHLHHPEWKAPQSWQPLPLDAIRKGAWNIVGSGGSSAEVTVTVFPGDVGGMLMNVNRWRGQLGQAPITEAELSDYVATRHLGGASSPVVTLVGDNGQTMIVALVPHDGATWFFKVMGDSALISASASEWEGFLQSIHFAGH